MNITRSQAATNWFTHTLNFTLIIMYASRQEGRCEKRDVNGEKADLCLRRSQKMDVRTYPTC